MARSNRHDDNEETDFFEEYEQALKERVKSLKKVEDATDAKALIALSEKLTKTKFKIYEDFQKKAKKIVEEMDEVMRVFVAEELREEYLAPQEDDETVVCEHCDLVRGESDYVECECDKERMTQFAEEVGACLSDYS
jgi:recombinational DNA repair ATPase RecF